MESYKDIPSTEVDYFLDKIAENPEYLDISFIKDKYTSFGLTVIPNPKSNGYINVIKTALINQTPLSVIRIGDGEANFLSYGQYPKTPVLNELSFKKIVAMQQDRFDINAHWMSRLQADMKSAIKQADIVGAIGLWRAGKPNIQSLQGSFLKDPRGISGHWRSIDYMLNIAQQGLLKDKIITSAHLYFSILDNLNELMKSSKKTLIINNNPTISERLEVKFNKECIFVPVGNNEQNHNQNTPTFLLNFHKKLPSCLKGVLCLIGAGPWSEFYCFIIKQKGGVAIDIGSGFDLLDGETIRPVHKLLDLDQYNPYQI